MAMQIGAFDAKAKLSELLRGVKQGQRYTITLRGEPIADLVPSESSSLKDTRSAITAMAKIHKIKGVSNKTLSEWITEGRR